MAVSGATIIDGTGRDPIRDGVIVTEGGVITAVGPRSSVDGPAGARVIDASGKYVIPGLMDANVHLMLGSAVEFIVIRALIERKIYCAIQPFTDKRIEIALEQAEGGPPSSRRKEKVRTVHVNDVNLIKAGVPLLLATDAGMADPDRLATMSAGAQIDRPTELGEAHFRWFTAVAEKGMKPMDAILAATRNVAAAYRKLDRVGTIERGTLADLVVLDADPLAELANVRRISLVIKQGGIVDRDALPLRRVLTLPRGAGPPAAKVPQP